ACAAAGRLSGGALITLHSGLGPDWLLENPARGAMARSVLAQFSRVIAVSAPIRQALARCGVRDVEVVPAFPYQLIQPGTPPAGLAGLRAKAAPLYCATPAPRREYAQRVRRRAS